MALQQFNMELISPSSYDTAVMCDSTGKELPAPTPFRSATYTFTRPADTTQYTAGDLIANSTTAGSVVPMSWVVGKSTGRPTSIRKFTLTCSNPTITGGTYKIFLFNASPTIATAGDNGAFASDVSIVGYIGESGTITASGFSDGSGSTAAPLTGTEITVLPTVDTIYGLLTTTGTPTPLSAETFSVTLEGWQY